MRAADILSRLSPKRAAHMIRLGDYWLALHQRSSMASLAIWAAYSTEERASRVARAKAGKRPYRRNSAKATTQAATSSMNQKGGGFGMGQS
jgi:hypothetical protein